MKKYEFELSSSHGCPQRNYSYTADSCYRLDIYDGILELLLITAVCQSGALLF